MQFHLYPSSFRQAARMNRCKVETAIEAYLADRDDETTEMRQDENMKFAAAWHLLREPFVRVYPPCIRMIENTSLDVPVHNLRMPDECMMITDRIGVHECRTKPGVVAIEFPVGHEPHGIGSILLGYRKLEDGYAFNVEIHIPKTNMSFVAHTFLDGDETFEKSLSCYQDELDNEVATFAFRCAIICLFVDREDPETLMRRCVLRKDKDKFEETLDPKFVDKAERRGVIGWNLGEGIEIAPHFRRPHFAKRWTGRGKAILKMVPVKGCFVNYKKWKVPEGFHQKEANHA